MNRRRLRKRVVAVRQLIVASVPHLLAAALLCIPTVGTSQIVRGTVVDRSDQPLAGVGVTLLDSAETAVNRSLTNELRAATLTGIVGDSAGRPLSNAEVGIPTLTLTTRTDSAGQFRIADIPAGIHAVVVRRVGFGPVSASLVFVDNETETRNFVLRPITVLPNVAVNAERIDAGMAEFEDRRRMGFGTFLSRDKLERFDEHSLARVLPQLPGARIVRGSGNRTWVASTRTGGGLGGDGKTGLSTSDRMSGASSNQCYAKVYVDNVLMYGAKPGEMLFDVNSLNVSQVEAVEYFAGAAQTPARYAGLGANCGVMVIWTRRQK